MHDSFRSTRTVQDRPDHASDRGDRGAVGRPADLAADSLLDRVSRIRRYSRNGFVAPNKPVTLLWALARLEEGKPRLTPFSTAEDELREPLDLFGTPGTLAVHAFWRLQRDEVWEVVASGDLETPPRKEPHPEAMRAYAGGGFLEPDQKALAADANLRRAVEAVLLEQLRASVTPGAYVPPPAGAQETITRIARHARVKRGAMVAFGSRCAVCGWSVKKNGNPVALSVAHVHAVGEKGPDAPGNAFVLCSHHHALFDTGLFAYDEQRRLIVSSAWEDAGRGGMPSLHDYAGIALPEPDDPSWRLRDAHLEWHRDKVFAA